MDLNRAQLAGRLTRDPELRYTTSGKAVTNMNLAINRRYKSGDEWKDDVSYVRIVVWGKSGENCAEYLVKGSNVFVEGHIQSRSWEGQDGKKQYATDVVASNVQYLTKKKVEEKPVDEPPVGEPPLEDQL